MACNLLASLTASFAAIIFIASPASSQELPCKEKCEALRLVCQNEQKGRPFHYEGTGPGGGRPCMPQFYCMAEKQKCLVACGAREDNSLGKGCVPGLAPGR